MKKISVFDTTISDFNLGNEIIMDSIWRELRSIFPDDFFFKLPIMEITGHTLKYTKNSDLIFFGGTNSLSSKMETYRQWNLNLANCWQIKNVVLMGSGWWKYQPPPSFYTKFLLRHSLSKNFIHSVRDSYTESKLREAGISKVLNTGCPTLWTLTNDNCAKIPREKSQNAVITFTDYKQNLDRDRAIFEAVSKNYQTVYAWIQGAGDFAYFQKNFPQVKLISPNLQAFDDLLSAGPIDYIGTRLHAGIRALQHQRRSIIIGIDNRAIEMHKDFNLPVIEKKSLCDLPKLIRTPFSTEIQLPIRAINDWKEQFKSII